ncbi:MAG: zinc ribbon domain-containing protein [Lachnospiraceae bacterium]|nr:zinc ribbon domain-containing protein [Lachnospiraceae bacterium]
MIAVAVVGGEFASDVFSIANFLTLCCYGLGLALTIPFWIMGIARLRRNKKAWNPRKGARCICCGHINPTESVFCNNCGTKQIRGLKTGIVEKYADLLQSGTRQGSKAVAVVNIIWWLLAAALLATTVTNQIEYMMMAGAPWLLTGIILSIMERKRIGKDAVYERMGEQALVYWLWLFSALFFDGYSEWGGLIWLVGAGIFAGMVFLQAVFFSRIRAFIRMAHAVCLILIVARVGYAFGHNRDVNGLTYTIKADQDGTKYAYVNNNGFTDSYDRNLEGRVSGPASGSRSLGDYSYSYDISRYRQLDVRERVWIGFREYEVRSGQLSVREGSKVSEIRIPEGMEVSVHGDSNSELHSVSGANYLYLNGTFPLLQYIRNCGDVSLDGEYPILSEITASRIPSLRWSERGEFVYVNGKPEGIFPGLAKVELSVDAGDIYNEDSFVSVAESVKGNGGEVKLHINSVQEDMVGSWEIGTGYSSAETGAGLVMLTDFPQKETDALALKAYGALANDYDSRKDYEEGGDKYISLNFQDNGYVTVTGGGQKSYLPEGVFQYAAAEGMLTISVDGALAQMLSVSIPYRQYGRYLVLEINKVPVVLHR